MVYLITMITGGKYQLYLEESQEDAEFENWLVSPHTTPDMVSFKPGIWISRHSIAYVERKSIKEE